MPHASSLLVGGKTLAVSNLEKVLYPETGFTKGQVIQYYMEIAPYLLPHLQGRALTMKRYPDGVDKFFFYAKNCPPNRPRWVKQAAIFSERKGGAMHYCVIDNLPSLIWAANLADLELHVALARAQAPNRPTAMVFDLDPGEGATQVHCARVALWIAEKLRLLKLKGWAKTSGSKGLQLYVPLNCPCTFEQTKTIAQQIALAVELEHPAAVVSKMRKVLRRKKVLIDWSQNDRHKTTVCVYSLRATAEPHVSTPLRWPEVEKLARGGSRAVLSFTPAQALGRAKKWGDLFAPVLEVKQTLPRFSSVSS